MRLVCPTLRRGCVVTTNTTTNHKIGGGESLGRRHTTQSRACANSASPHTFFLFFRRARRQGVVKTHGTFRRKPAFQGLHRPPFVVGGEMSVPHRHLNLLVSHQRSNGRYIDSSHYWAAGECVAQIVPCKVFDSSLATSHLARGASLNPALNQTYAAFLSSLLTT